MRPQVAGSTGYGRKRGFDRADSADCAKRERSERGALFILRKVDANGSLSVCLSVVVCLSAILGYPDLGPVRARYSRDMPSKHGPHRRSTFSTSDTQTFKRFTVKRYQKVTKTTFFDPQHLSMFSSFAVGI